MPITDFRARGVAFRTFNADAVGPKLLKMKTIDEATHHYNEVQMHGGVKLQDIEEVIFGKQPAAPVRQLLNEQGLKWRVVDFPMEEE